MDWTITNMSMWGMGTWLIILLLFLFNWNGNVFFWRWNNNAGFFATNDLINNNTSWEQHSGDMANNNFQTYQVTQGMNNINNTVMQGFLNLQPNFCEINRNIDRSIYESQKNTCSIITNQNENTQKILDKLTQNEIDRLRTDLQSAQLTLSNSAQSQYLISQLKTTA